MKTYRLRASLLGLLIGVVGTAHAAFPAGNWQVVQKDFITGAAINTVSMCIKADGTIVGEGWSGHWKMKVSTVLMRMEQDYEGDGKIDVEGEYTLTKLSNTTMSGTNQAWFVGDTSSLFYTTGKWTRVGNCL